MKTIFRPLRAGYLTAAAAIIASVLLLGSCSGSSDTPEPTPTPSTTIDRGKPAAKAQRTVLIYSVAANDLINDLRRDSVEMTQAAPSIEGLDRDVRVLLYLAPRVGQPTLSELTYTDGNAGEFQLIKTYDTDHTSTDPSRIRRVIDDVKYLRPASRFGIILESHATGWSPDFNTHSYIRSRGENNGFDPGMAYSFGADNTKGTRDSIDLIEMDDAFPPETFDFIWFDACYMAGVEVAYQLRDKAETYVGYVTEVGSNGMPYDETLPLIAKPTPDFAGAAEKLYDWYMSRGGAVTVSVIDLARMEALAAAAAPLLSLEDVPYSGWLQKYSRFSTGPFYDFGQYVNLCADGLETSEAERDAFNAALEKAVTYKAISDYDFNRNPFDAAVYSGLSCHVPGTSRSDDREAYYLLTDWAKAVYK